MDFSMQASDRISRRMKLQDLHVFMTVVFSHGVIPGACHIPTLYCDGQRAVIELAKKN